MSYKRINKQQQARIDKKQQNYRQRSDFEDDTLNRGLVITRYSKHAYIEDQQGNLFSCSIRSNIDTIVAGDEVIWQEDCHGQAVILSRAPRKSTLGRPDSNGKIKPVAANISQIMIVIAPEPLTSWNLLDSYLVMAEHLQINPYIVLNKTDLECEDLRYQLLKIYEPLGYPLLFTNKNSDSDKQLKNALQNNVSVLVGQSGVGKSSIIGRILPHEADKIRTNNISTDSKLGKHTTSNSVFYHLDCKGGIIDSPGIRELSLWNMQTRDIAACYREFAPYINQCKFRDCKHFNTPGCAIENAVKNKIISQERYENYLKMIEYNS